jgi:hypothetical protein
MAAPERSGQSFMSRAQPTAACTDETHSRTRSDITRQYAKSAHPVDAVTADTAGNIEHEGLELGRLEGLNVAAETLSEAKAAPRYLPHRGRPGLYSALLADRRTR